MLHLAAPVGHAHEVLPTRLHPLDRPGETARGGGDDHRLGRRFELAAEPATDLRRTDAYERRVEPEALGHRIADGVDTLRRGPQHHTVAVRKRERAVGLHRRRRDPLVHETTPHDDVRVIEDGLLVPRRELPNHRGGHVIDGARDRERLDLEDHEFDGVDGVGNRVGDDDRDRFADEADRVPGQRRAREARVEHRMPSQWRQPEVVARQHGHNTPRRPRRRWVEADDAAVGEVSAHEGGVELVTRQVRQVPTGAAEQ